MAFYMLQATFTRDKWKAMVAEPGQRPTNGIRSATQKLGGSVIRAFLAFGEYDIVEIYEIPDNISAAAVSAALSSTANFKAIKTTPLIDIELCSEVLGRAKEAG